MVQQNYVRIECNIILGVFYPKVLLRSKNSHVEIRRALITTMSVLLVFCFFSVCSRTVGVPSLLPVVGSVVSEIYFVRERSRYCL